MPLKTPAAVLALTILLSALAHAGPISCLESVASVPILNPASSAALVGEVLLHCTDGTPTADGSPVTQFNFVLTLDAPVAGSPAPLLLVNDPGSPSNPIVQICASTSGCTMLGVAPGIEPYDGSPGHANEF